MAKPAIKDGLFTPEILSKELLRLVMDAGVMKDCVNRDYEGEIKNQGDTVKIITPGEVTVSEYDTSTPIEYQELDGDKQTLEINQKMKFGFIIDDIEEVQANIKYAQKYMQNAKKAIVNVQDGFLLAKSADVPSANQLGDVALSAANAYSKLCDLMERLQTSNAVDSQGKGTDGKNPWLVVNPKVLGIFKQAPEAIHSTTAGDETVRKGRILHLAGFDIKMSTVLKPVDTQVTCLAGTTEAITFAEQIIKTEILRDKDRFGDFVRGLYVYGAKTVQPTCLASFAATGLYS